MYKILLVEDDYYIRRDLGQMLSGEGYTVFLAESRSEGLQYLFREKDIDLYLLDLWLPDGDGFSLLKTIREGSSAPVLFLTVCDDEPSVIQALEQGADDYITKPFRKAELLSRIRANLRRQTLQQEGVSLEAEGLMLNPQTHEVAYLGEPVSLRPAEYRLLYLLMQNPGILITRERLLSELDQDTYTDGAENNTLNVQISRLRKAVPKNLIRTERGFGYRFTGRVRKLYGIPGQTEAGES